MTDLDDWVQKSMRTNDLAWSGMQLAPSEASALELKVKKNPADTESRIVLLGYYSLRRFRSARDRKARVEHVAWFVENEPEHFILDQPANVCRSTDGRKLYVDIKERWLKQIGQSPGNTSILKHAAQFFIDDEKHLTERCLKTAKELEPANPEWSLKLAALYQLWGSGREDLAIAECEECIALESKSWHTYSALERLPELLLRARRTSKAIDSANRLLVLCKDWDVHNGRAIQCGHTVLGRIALYEGDVEKAKCHLLLSVTELQSPQPKTDSPEDRLAAELLRAGQRDVVLQYWEQCAERWESGRHQLESRRREIASGGPQASSLRDGPDKFFDLTFEPRSAFNRGDFEAARVAAQELLTLAEERKDDERHYGYAIQIAHVVLGQLALRDRDLKKAKSHLKLAGDVPDSERLFEHGPDLSLAADLVNSNEISVVRKFLQKVDRFWNDPQERPDIDRWIEKISTKQMNYDLLW